jgi:hypothetical protein
MNRKGQLGQIITSFPVLLLVLVIMVLFVIVAGFISAFGGVEESVSVHGIEEINSKILLEMFLGDYVLVDGKKEKIEDAILEMSNSGLIVKGELAKLIKQRFGEKYDCREGNNLLIFLSKSGKGVPDFSERAYVEEVDYDLPVNYLEVSYADLSEGFSKKELEDRWFIATKGNIKC